MRFVWKHLHFGCMRGSPMRIAIAADHAGFALKEQLRRFVVQLGHEVHDLGARNEVPSDYPDFAQLVGAQLMTGVADRGILICGSGVGVCVAVNKMPGIRAAVCHDTYSGHQGVQHDDMNVLVMGSRIVGLALAQEITTAYLEANFDTSEERFARRLDKVKAIERRYMLSAAKSS
jgi:ribose 5-phosphate isomerase B